MLWWKFRTNDHDVRNIDLQYDSDSLLPIQPHNNTTSDMYFASYGIYMEQCL